MLSSFTDTLDKTFRKLEAKRCGKKPKRKLHAYQVAAIHYSKLLKVPLTPNWIRFFRDVAQPSIMPRVVTFVSDYPAKKDRVGLIYWAHKYLLERTGNEKHS